MKRLASFALLTFICVTSFGQSVFQKKEYTAVRISSPPKIDGLLDDSVWITGNFSHQHADTKNAAEEPHNSPSDHFYLRTTWQFHPLWRLSGQVNYVMGRDRLSTDPRDTIDDYSLVDLSLRSLSLLENIELALSIKNIFDQEAVEPTTPNIPTIPDIPNDLPLAKRSVYGEVTYKF